MKRKYIDFYERLQNIISDVTIEIAEMLENNGKNEYTFSNKNITLTLIEDYENDIVFVDKLRWDEDESELYVVTSDNEVYCISDFENETLALLYLYDELYSEMNKETDK